MAISPTAIDAAHWEAVEEAAELMAELRHGDALLLLRDAIRADPTNPYAYHHLGAAFHAMKNLEGARDAYRTAVRLAPDFLGSRVGLSHALRQLGDAEAALAEAKEALRRFPKDVDALEASDLAKSAMRTTCRDGRATGREFGTTDEPAEEKRQILAMLGIDPDETDETDETE